jgi:hypothetical protein
MFGRSALLDVNQNMTWLPLELCLHSSVLLPLAKGTFGTLVARSCHLSWWCEKITCLFKVFTWHLSLGAFICCVPLSMCAYKPSHTSFLLLKPIHPLTFIFIIFSLMYGAEDPSIAGMVLDSPFSNLVDLMMELVDTYKYPLPKFTVSSLMISTSPLVSC